MRGELAVVVPSRGRPEAVEALAHRIDRTSTAATALIVVVDRDDPDAAKYPAAAERAPGLPGLLSVENSIGAAQAVNAAAYRYAPDVRAVMYLPDSMVPVAVGWDTALLRALDSHGFARGHDADLRPWRWPRHIAVRSQVVEALGYLVHPSMTNPDGWPDLWAHWAMLAGGMGIADDAVFARSPALDSRTVHAWTPWTDYCRDGHDADVSILTSLAAAWDYPPVEPSPAGGAATPR